MHLTVLKAGDPVAELAQRRGDFAAWIRETVGDAWAGEWRVHDIREDSPLPPIEGAAGFIITGSSSSVTERAPWMLRAEAYVRELVATKTPLFGICFGHQMMAQALGGLVTKNPLGREIGTVRVEREGDDAIFSDIPAVFEANETHVDAVVRLPEGARLLARTSKDAAAAFAVGDAARAVQFHPEIDADAMRGYVTARAPLMQAEGIDPDAVHRGVREAPHAQALLGNFVRRFVQRP